MTAILATVIAVAGCSEIGGANASTKPSASPTPVATIAETEPPWPLDWPDAVCAALVSLATATDDLNQGYDSALVDDVLAASDLATEATDLIGTTQDALANLAEWEQGNGVTINLNSQAAHLSKAAAQLVSWVDTATAAKLETVKKEIAAAAVNASRAEINQGTLEKATEFTCAF